MLSANVNPNDDDGSTDTPSDPFEESYANLDATERAECRADWDAEMDADAERDRS